MNQSCRMLPSQVEEHLIESLLLYLRQGEPIPFIFEQVSSLLDSLIANTTPSSRGVAVDKKRRNWANYASVRERAKVKARRLRQWLQYDQGIWPGISVATLSSLPGDSNNGSLPLEPYTDHFVALARLLTCIPDLSYRAPARAGNHQLFHTAPGAINSERERIKTMALEKTLPIMLIFLIGVALKKVGVLRKEDGRMISRLILNVVLPATIINALSSMTISPSLLLLPLASVIVVTLLLGIGFALAPILGLQGKTRAAFLISFPTLEVSSIGYAFMVAVYGVGGLALIAFFDLGDALFFFLVVPLLASLLGRSAKHFRVSDALMLFLKNPVLWAYAVGIAFNSFHIHILLLSNLFTTLSQALLLLIMLLIASEFELSFSTLAFPVLVMYLKMAVGVTLGLLISLILGLTGVEQVAVVLGSSLPASLMSVAYAREYKLDTRFLASTLSLALPTAIAFSFVIMSICH